MSVIQWFSKCLILLKNLLIFLNIRLIIVNFREFLYDEDRMMRRNLNVLSGFTLLNSVQKDPLLDIRRNNQHFLRVSKKGIFFPSLRGRKSLYQNVSLKVLLPSLGISCFSGSAGPQE